MMLKGKAIKLKDNINTDLIISGRYKFAITDMKELAKHIFEDMDPEFPKKISPGNTIIVAGRNFGLGSSREQAPLVIKEAGIIAVLAKSFARIFYRNAINIGLTLFELNTQNIKESDILEINTLTGAVKGLTRDIRQETTPLPKFMQAILKEGGILNYYKRHKRLPEV